MTEAEAIAKLETAFPGAACSARNDGRMVWFEVKGGIKRPGLAFSTYDKVDRAIALWKHHDIFDAMLAEAKGG